MKFNATQKPHHHWYMSVSMTGDEHVALECTKTKCNQVWTKDNETPSIPCCNVVERYEDAERCAVLRTIARMKLPRIQFQMNRPRVRTLSLAVPELTIASE